MSKNPKEKSQAPKRNYYRRSIQERYNWHLEQLQILGAQMSNVSKNQSATPDAPLLDPRAKLAHELKVNKEIESFLLDCMKQRDRTLSHKPETENPGWFPKFKSWLKGDI